MTLFCKVNNFSAGSMRRHGGSCFQQHSITCAKAAASSSRVSAARHTIPYGYGFPMQTTSCTWPYVVPIGEDPAAHGHWCTFTDLYHTIPYHAIPGSNALRTHYTLGAGATGQPRRVGAVATEQRAPTAQRSTGRQRKNGAGAAGARVRRGRLPSDTYGARWELALLGNRTQ